MTNVIRCNSGVYRKRLFDLRTTALQNLHIYMRLGRWCVHRDCTHPHRSTVCLNCATHVLVSMRLYFQAGSEDTEACETSEQGDNTRCFKAFPRQKPSPERKVAISLVLSLKHWRGSRLAANVVLKGKRLCITTAVCLTNQPNHWWQFILPHSRQLGCFEAPILVWFVLNWCNLQHG